ncbi:MAG: CBS domain-containing protein [Thermodesulfobacteriota bacterium]
MTRTKIDACIPVDLSDDDIYEAMKDIPGYLDITLSDFKEVYLRAYRHATDRLLKSLKAEHIMTRDVVAVEEDTPLAEVAKVMAQRRISGVPVIAREGRVVGVISEKDFLLAMGGPGTTTFMEVAHKCLGGGQCLVVPSDATRAADIMSTPAVTVTESWPVTEISELMARKGINRVPVLGPDGTMTGIISRGDIVGSSLVPETP